MESSKYGPVNVVEYEGKLYVNLTQMWDFIPLTVNRRKQLHKYDNLWQKCLLVGISMEHSITCRRGDIHATVHRGKPGQKTLFVTLRQWDECIGYQKKQMFAGIPDNLIRSDGFVHFQKFCSMAGKGAQDVKLSKNFVSFKTLLEEEIGGQATITTDDGSIWIHPRLADFVASRADVAFFVKVTGWLERAKAMSARIREEHAHALARIKASDGKGDLEKRVRDRLAEEIDGEIEYPVDSTTAWIDIVTESELIEVKRALNSTHVAQALGQILNYSYRVGGDRKMRVHVFGTEQELVKSCDANLIRLFKDQNIRVTQEVVCIESVV